MVCDEEDPGTEAPGAPVVEEGRGVRESDRTSTSVVVERARESERDSEKRVEVKKEGERGG